MEKLNVVVLTSDIDLRIHIKNRIVCDDIVIAGYSDFSEAAKLKILGMFPDVVLCAVNGKVGDDIFQFVQNMLCDVHGCVVVLMTDSMDVELASTAAQFGIRRVVPIDISSDELEECLRKVYFLEQQRLLDTNISKRVRSKVIGFFGGKGGTGKTTVAANVASMLSKKGKRVILIDCDLQFGDIGLVMDLEPKDTIVELVQDRNGITIENINSFTMLHNTGVSVLCGPKSPEYAEYVKPEHIEKIVDTMRPYYEYIVIDLPPAFNDVSIAALENCDQIVLIYNMDILSLKNAKVCISILDQLQQKDKVNIVINKSMNGLIKAKDFEKMFEMPIYGQLPYDAKSATLSVNKGQPLVIALPRCEISKGIDALSDKIMKDK